ncbi:hypothetical protein ACFV24_05265 [Nocardia fluminea]|uniref:hypothetical protein n=1 Tax=Nocardia fluminea TaxID=134984 RepID=UPI0036707CD4
MKKMIVTSVLLTTALGAVPAVASAGPTDAAVQFSTTATEKSTRISLDSGAIVVDNGVLAIKSANGTTVAGTALSFRVDDFVFPITAEVKDRTATLTPRFDAENAVYQPVALPFEDQAPWKNQYEREQAAWSRLTSTIAMGATVGTVAGGLSGAAVGCVLGGIAGATVASATIIGLFGAFVPAAVIGCVGGIVAIGALGTLTGQLLVTAPVAIMAAVQYFTTITQPAPTPAPAK